MAIKEQPTNSAERLQHLLARCALRDRAAFLALYEATSANLFGIALRILKKRHWAEEVLQESFVKIWQHAGGYDANRGAAMTWMINIVRNQALDLRRRADFRSQLNALPADEVLADSETGPADNVEASAQLERLRRCLQRLGEDQRATVLMVHHEGYTPNEVAQKKHIPIGTVKTWIRRGLVRLRECMRP